MCCSQYTKRCRPVFLGAAMQAQLPRREFLGNPHSPGPIAPGPARPASRQLSHNALQTLLAPVPCWGHWTGQQPLRLLKHTKQFSQTGVQRLPALPLYTDLRGPIRVGRKAYPREPLTRVVSGGGQAAYDQVRGEASYLPLQHPTLCAYYYLVCRASPTNGARYGRAVNAVFVLESDQNSDLDSPLL
jgi:hypothetical protein